MRHLASLLVIFGLLLSFSTPAGAQSTVEIADVQVNYTFGEEITFSARIQSQVPIQEAYLLFQVEGDQNTRTVPLVLAPDGTTEFIYSIQSGLVRPFSRINYWFHLLLNTGEALDSAPFSFHYDDNRYPWQMLEDENLRLFWYAGDLSFGQAALDAARAGLQTIRTMIPASAGDPISIYIYATSEDVQDVLNLSGYNWIAGYASPDLGVVLVSIEPGETQGIEMERQIPHELAHVLLYRQIGAAYANLPTWLLEGIAMQAEQYPNANYAQVLAAAIESNSLLPVSNLCGPFPADASGAILAYAESDSFTRYLRDAYGAIGLQALIQSYGDGMNCDQGAIRALGVPLAQLDQQWQKDTLGEETGGVNLQGLFPYLLLLGVVLIGPICLTGLEFFKKGHGHGEKSG